MKRLRLNDPRDAWFRAFAQARWAQEWARCAFKRMALYPGAARHRASMMEARERSRASQEALHEALDALLAEQRVYEGASRWTW